VLWSSIVPSASPPVVTWFDHERARRALQAVLALTDPLGIPVLPVKGAILARTLYADVSERPISDLDLRVRPADLRRVRALCRAEGWPTANVSPQWGTFDTAVGSLLVELETSVGPPGLCAIGVEEMIGRAARTTAGFGFAHLEPEIHDHALLLCVNAFKDKIRDAVPAALGDLVRIAALPSFEPPRLVELAGRGRVRALVWIVADWAAREGPSAPWGEVRDRLGRTPPRPLYVRAYQALMAARPRGSRVVFPIVARVGSDDPALRARALLLGGAGVVQRALDRAFRAGDRRVT
jgi:hypothetical protein